VYINNKVLVGKGWVIISLNMLFIIALAGANQISNPGADSWIDQLGQPPLEVPTQIRERDALIDLAIQRNSDLRAQYAEWQGSLAATSSISRLPDPTLGLGYFVESVETAQGPQRAKISLGQSITWFSKTRAARESSEFLSIQSFQALETLRLSLIREINKFWAEAGHLQSISVLIKAKIALSRDLEAVVSVQYQSASASHKKLVEVQIQTLQLENDLLDVESQVHRLKVNLGAILELDSPVADNFLPNISSYPDQTIPSGRVSVGHPRFQQLEAGVNRASAEKASAQAAFIPDLKIGLDYILTDKKLTNGAEVSGSGKDPLMLSVGIALPLWNWKSNQAGVKMAEWREKKARALLNTEHFRLVQEYELSLSALEEDLRRIQLYETQLIPKARDIEKVMQQEYISQSSDISTYTMARLHVLDLQLILINTQYSAQLQIVDLSYLKGN